MVWPVRACHSLKVSISKGAEPEMNKRMWLVACLVRPGSASMRTYSVGTPMNTVAFAIFSMASFGSNFPSQIILLPLSSAPWSATNKPWTWKIGNAWISTSPALQPQ